ncbi:F-box/kelch-repeat protein At3g06240-like [Vicia villosa]|uniref:F-box/kelch-repeat protein At3g06240-like n=1 Tax=Vicia villosa TaxID=3911 RepID=UPI00273AB811|nr:F-box/kelch-repeat protein At3g06240-like [Vicia villosa]
MAKYGSEKVRNHIPDDLAIPILSKLPLKSLKRFGCVNKSWSVLFENPKFMVEFRNNFISISHSYYNDTSLLLHQIVCNHNRTYISFYLHSLSGERLENKVKLDLPNPFQQEELGFYVLVSGSINGILCLYDRDTIVMWNPTTGEFKVIPPSRVESLPPYQGIIKYLHGFGYDPFSDDYKIIRKVIFVPVTDDDDDDDIPPCDVKWKDMCENYEPFWEVYSLVYNSWRKVDLILPTCCWEGGNRNDNLLYLDGMCHWLSNSYGEYNEEYLVSFDLANEICFTTLIPTLMPLDIDPNNWVSHALVLLNGSIASILWYTNTFHISILGKVGVKESWTKIFVVGPLSDDIKFPIGAGKNGDIFFAKKEGREPICFDLCTQMIEELDGVKGAYNSQIIIYKESLVSIGGKHH